MAKKRGNGEGSISYHKASKRYIAQYTKPNGKRGTIYGKTREEARKQLTKVLAEIQTQSYTDKSNITLIEIIKTIVEDKHNANKINSNTYRTNLDTIKRIEKDSIAKMQIQKITTEHLKDYMNRMVNVYNYSEAIINKNYGLINLAYRKAVIKGYVRRNLLDNKEELSKPKSKIPVKKVCAFTIDEQVKLMSALNNYDNVTYKNIILLALFTGMRSGEILALKLNDIDLKNKIIHIKRSLSRDVTGKQIIGETTKTRNSSRDVIITDNVEKILKNSMQKMIINYDGLLFCTEEGKTISNGMINSAFKRLCKKYNIGKGFDVNFHMLRHTYATRCIESGMQVKVLSKKLGHKDISITLNTYTDVFSKMEDRFDNQFGEYLIENNIGLQ